jgi:hypothetical protein
MIALALSVTALIISIGAATASRSQRRRVEVLTDRYAEAIALVALIARVDPPIPLHDIRVACDRLLTLHGVDVTKAGGSVH